MAPMDMTSRHIGRRTVERNTAHHSLRSTRGRIVHGFLSMVVLAGACTRSEQRATSDSATSTAEAGRTPASSVEEPIQAGSLGAGVVYTANEGGRSVSRIDLGTGRVLTFPVGIRPHNVQISRDGQHVFTVGSLSGAMAGMDMADSSAPEDEARAELGQLLVLSAAASDTVGATRITIGREPAHVILGATGERAYATSVAENAVLVVDVPQQRVIDTIPTAFAPHGLRMHPDGREIYVAGTAANAVSVLDVARSTETARIKVGRGPVQVGFLPDGSRVYVTLRDDNAVAVIDTRTRRMITVIPVGRSPIQLFATPDGRFVYVANQGSEAQPDSTVSVIDTQRNAVVKTLTTGRGAHGVVVSDDGQRMFITNTFAGTVSVIDVQAQRVIGTVRVGAEPGGITYRARTP